MAGWMGCSIPAGCGGWWYWVLVRQSVRATSTTVTLWSAAALPSVPVHRSGGSMGVAIGAIAPPPRVHYFYFLTLYKMCKIKYKINCQIIKICSALLPDHQTRFGRLCSLTPHQGLCTWTPLQSPCIRPPSHSFWIRLWYIVLSHSSTLIGSFHATRPRYSQPSLTWQSALLHRAECKVPFSPHCDKTAPYTTHEGFRPDALRCSRWSYSRLANSGSIPGRSRPFRDGWQAYLTDKRLSLHHISPTSRIYIGPTRGYRRSYQTR